MTTANGEIGFNSRSDHWLDVAEFEKTCEISLAKPFQVLTDADIRLLNGALALYTGELLEGFCDEWAIFERERLRLLYIQSQSHLLDHYRYNGNLEQALAFGRAVLKLDPLREEFHRSMMRLCADAGERTLALRQYEICKDAIDAELGISPMKETRNLMQRIRQEKTDARQPGDSNLQETDADQTIIRLKKVLNACEQSVSKLKQAASILEHLMKSK